MGGKPKRDGGPTREAERLVALILEVEREERISHAEVARRLKLSPNYVSKLVLGDRQGIGTEVIRHARDAFNVDVHYFYDDYDGVRSYHAYPLQRNADRVRALEERLARLEKLSLRAKEARH